MKLLDSIDRVGNPKAYIYVVGYTDRSIKAYTEEPIIDNQSTILFKGEIEYDRRKKMYITMEDIKDVSIPTIVLFKPT